MIYTRSRLAHFRKNGPTCLYINYGLNFAVTLVYEVAAAVVFGSSFIVSTNSVSGFGFILPLVLNIIYFNKRKALFDQ